MLRSFLLAGVAAGILLLKSCWVVSGAELAFWTGWTPTFCFLPLVGVVSGVTELAFGRDDRRRRAT